MTQVAENVTFKLGEAHVTIPAKSFMKVWLDSLTTTIAPSAHAVRPLLAAGESYAGIMLGKNRAADYRLILLPSVAKDVTYDEAVEWAASTGGVLPDPSEQCLLRANLNEEFLPACYWSGKQDAEDPSFAWIQGFGHGTQGYGRKDDRFHARVVRRELIE
ncbi:DUF1566 domain-containing protein [Cupriavidus sp. WS]|uniref:DUF1566 domain-containing protein n=1 Tax=Cupriavidus sp. WS TaxID=1312922 RepID=UPI000379A7AF|nr:DUF1566 domain-containing protein [Cupriavidus sp. WS]